MKILNWFYRPTTRPRDELENLRCELAWAKAESEYWRRAAELLSYVVGVEPIKSPVSTRFIEKKAN